MGKTRLFVDMDGTLAEFKPVDQLETLYEKGYFENLKPLDNVVGATKEIIRNHPEIEVHILSAHLSDSPYALAEKNAWLDRYLPEIPAERRLFPPCGTDKAGAIPGGLRPTDFLLDDYTHNLTLWEPPARGVKLLNGINHTRGSWKRDCLRYDTPPQELAGNIAKIMRDGIQIRDEKPARPIAAELVSAPVNTPVEGAHTVRTNGETTAPVTTTDEFAVHSVRTAKETQVTAPPAGGTVTPPVHPKALTNEEFEQLWEEIQNITLHYQEDPAMVAEFLAFKAQFYQYSARNALLIQRQKTRTAPLWPILSSGKSWGTRLIKAKST